MWVAWLTIRGVSHLRLSSFSVEYSVRASDWRSHSTTSMSPKNWRLLILLWGPSSGNTIGRQPLPGSSPRLADSVADPLPARCEHRRSARTRARFLPLLVCI